MNIKQELEDLGYAEVQDTSLLCEDLNMDSLDMAQLGTDLDIPDKAWATLKTVGDLQTFYDKQNK